MDRFEITEIIDEMKRERAAQLEWADHFKAARDAKTEAIHRGTAAGIGLAIRKMERLLHAAPTTH
jgi:hypothetical protein